MKKTRIGWRRPALVAALVGLAVGAGGGPAASAKDWKQIRIATEGAYAPWNYKDASGKLVGFELDLARDLCKRMHAKCAVVGQAWDGMIPALMAGKYDAIMAGMSITAKRKKKIDFSRSYAATPAKFVVPKDSPLASFRSKLALLTLSDVSAAEKTEIARIAATFKGKTIGVQTATTHENFLRRYLGNGTDIRTYDTKENLDLYLQADGSTPRSPPCRTGSPC